MAFSLEWTASILNKYFIYYFVKPNFYRNTNFWQIYCLCFEGVTDENIGRYPWQCLNKDTPLFTLLSFSVTLFYSDGKQSGERIEVSGVRFQASLGPKYIGDKTNHSFRTLSSDTYYKPVDLQTYVMYLCISPDLYTCSFPVLPNKLIEISNLYTYFACLSVCFSVCFIQLTSKRLNWSDLNFFCGTSRDPRGGLRMIELSKICL